MQELKTRDNFCGIKSSSALVKAALLLYVEHEVSTVEVFHHKEQMRLQENKTKVKNDLSDRSEIQG